MLQDMATMVKDLLLRYENCTKALPDRIIMYSELHYISLFPHFPHC